MADVPTPPAPGSMTVPPLFGWEQILTVLLLLIAVALVFLVLAAPRAGASERSEWQAWLDARSRRRHDPAPDPRDRSAERGGPAGGVRGGSPEGADGRAAPAASVAHTPAPEQDRPGGVRRR